MRHPFTYREFFNIDNILLNNIIRKYKLLRELKNLIYKIVK